MHGQPGQREADVVLFSGRDARLISVAHKRGIGLELADARFRRCMESPSVVSQLFIPLHSGAAGFFLLDVAGGRV